jgi:hypothetical protein
MAIQWFENVELLQGDEQGTEWETMIRGYGWAS